MRKGTTLILSAAVVLACWGMARAGDDKGESKAGDCCTAGPCSTVTDAAKAEPAQPVSLKDDTAAKQFEAIKGLAGTWESTEKHPDGSASICVFKVTANGSVVEETMLPGTANEMVNMYHLDGDKLIVTHYCAQGIQPRMKMASVDGKTIKFDFLDCTNLPSPDAPRMNDLSLTIDGNTLKESWGYFKDGKVNDYTNIDLKKKV